MDPDSYDPSVPDPQFCTKTIFFEIELTQKCIKCKLHTSSCILGFKQNDIDHMCKYQCCGSGSIRPMGSGYGQAIPLIFHQKENIPIFCKSVDYKESRSEIFMNRINTTPRIRIHTTPRIRIHTNPQSRIRNPAQVLNPYNYEKIILFFYPERKTQFLIGNYHSRSFHQINFWILTG